MANFIISENLQQVDPDVKRIIDLESERQNRKLIMIPSESSAPVAVRESLGSVLQNLYAEGYPFEFTRKYSEEEILDYESQILNFRRNSDPRYYKGVEFADILEELARRRCAELFANNIYSPEEIFVNVQALSGAPANNAVYQALIEPGDTVMGMSLFHGGHLTHGSSVNRSGKLYHAFHYSVDSDTRKINYDQVRDLARDKNPKIIIAGYSSYSWVPDWQRFKEIANEVGAYLFADISHIAGPISGKVIDSPVGFADVITFTTHKTLCGPRGACILSFDKKISRKIDRAVFPGEQGGPHTQVFAAMATSFKLAKSKQFIEFQSQILKNCRVLSQQLEKRGLRIEYGGTNTHLTNIDCKSVIGADGTVLSGDMAARILDIAGIVVNANTIPGDKSARRASGIRLGTPWLTQRGINEKDMIKLADIIADILFATKPYTYNSVSKTRAKIEFKVLERAKLRVRELTEKALPSVKFEESGYPFFHFLDDFDKYENSEWITLSLIGDKVRQCLNYIIPIGIVEIKSGNPVESTIFVDEKPFKCLVEMESEKVYFLTIKKEDAGLISQWLRGLSDGFIIFDKDLEKRIPGPFSVKPVSSRKQTEITDSIQDSFKPYYIGIEKTEKSAAPPLPDFVWQETEEFQKKTPLHEWHKSNGAKLIPFAGWDMPVWYSSVLEEHIATRNYAGLFDVTHMGIFQAEGIDAVSFLDSVCGNSIGSLDVGESCYTHFLDIQASVIDDLLVYRHDEDKFLLVVNAANEEKDWAWLTAVKNGSVRVDETYPHTNVYGRNCLLRNLKSPEIKEEMKVDIALQGPKSREILEILGLSKEDKKHLLCLKRTELCHVIWKNHDLIISRTGYTGETMAFELFIHPDYSVFLWETLLQIGNPLGLLPCGLGARDSLRTEAGLPLYGHELGGTSKISVGEAGFGAYVKTHKPWFIGRRSFIEQEKTRKMEVIRFRFTEKNVRLAHLGDLVLNSKGKAVGKVTSCAIDSDGFLTGHALIQKTERKIGELIYIYQSSNKISEISIKNIDIGQKIRLPAKAVILKRFSRFN